MATPILGLAGPAVTGPSASVANYINLIAGPGVNNWTTSALTRQTYFSVPGVISNLNVNYPSGGAYAVSLVQNGTITSLSCNTSGGPPAICTSASTVTVAAGDRLQWQSCPGTISGGSCSTAATTSNTLVQISATFTGTNNNESFIISSGAASGTNTASVNYGSFGGGVNSYATVEANATAPVPTAGVIDNLYVYAISQNVPGASKWWFATLFKNGAATSLQCSMTGTVAGAGVTQCNDTNAGHAVTVSAADTISVEYCPQSSSSYVTSCAVGGTPATNTFSAAVRWVPTIAGEAVIMDAANSLPSTSGNRFTAISGSGAGQGTESQAYNIIPAGMTFKKLAIYQQPQPGAGVTRTFNLRSGNANVGSPGSVQCTVAAGTGATGTCSDATNAYAASTNALMDIQTSVSGANTALTALATSIVVTVP